MRIKQVLVAFLFSIMLSALLICSGVQGQTFPSTSVLDDFNRSTEDPITGIWTNNLSTGTAECAVNGSNQATSGGGAGDCYTTATYGASQEVFATIPNAGSMTEDNSLFIMMCLQGTFGSSAVTGYGVRVRRRSAQNDVITLVKLSSLYGVTDLGTGWTSGELTSGLKVGARYESDGTFTLYWDADGVSGWSQLDQITGETTYSCANTHLGMELQGANPLDDFGGGTVATGTQALLGQPPLFFD